MANQKEDAPKRHDPAPRPYDGGGANRYALKNKRPDRHYVLVYKRDESSLQHYRDSGYEFERYGQGGTTPYVGKTGKEGDAIEMGGHVLMSISHEGRAAMDEAGLRIAEAMESKIIDKVNGLPDETRGIPSRLFGFQNNTSAAERL